MALPDLKEIKLRRKVLGLTQTQLAKTSGISQSLIAKIESEKIIPSYEKGKVLLDLLEELNEKEEVMARDLMSKNIIFVKEDECIKKAIELMNKHGYSQLPVLKDKQSRGLVSEKSLLEQMNLQKINPNKDKVKEIMEESLPVVGEVTPRKLLLRLLEHNPAVLVAKKGKIHGIVAKSDLLNALL